MIVDNAALASRPSVAIVGAGLSGLTAALRLEQAGVTDVVVVEARDRVGGRVDRITRREGRHLEAGAAWVSGPSPRVRALAAELGVAIRDEPAPPADRRLVRLAPDGSRHVERSPFEHEPAAAAALEDATRRLGALAASVDVAAPWESPEARELDAQTLHMWLTTNVGNPLIRDAIAMHFGSNGADAAELSLLFCLWTIQSHGGAEAWLAEFGAKLDGGPSTLVERLAGRVGAPIVLSAPVRRIERVDEMVVLGTDAGAVQAQVAILALSPTLCSRIEFEPALPVLRDRLQQRWLQGHGAKLFAIYERRWWLDEGLTGEVLGREPFPVVLDDSDPDRDEGVLCGLAFGGRLPDHASLLDDRGALEAAFVAMLGRAFGPPAAAPDEVHSRRWFGDTWSHGCGTGTPPGALIAIGPALREPVGRILWGGAETGAKDHLEGAVTSGERTAREAVDMLSTLARNRT